MHTSKIAIRHDAGFSFRHMVPQGHYGEETQSILLLHGMFGTGGYLEPMMRICAGLGYACYALDLPGHGISKTPKTHKMGIPQYVRYVEAFMEVVVVKESGTKPHVFGHSMGALIALMLASRPGCMHKTVAITPATFQEAKRGEFLWLHMTREILRAVPSKLFGLFNPFQYFRQGSAMLQGMNFFTYVYREGVWESLRASYQVVQEKMHLERRFKTPILVIGAGRDIVLPVHAMHRIVNWIGEHATLHIEPDFGHMAPFENAERMVEIITAWLAKDHQSKPKSVVAKKRRSCITNALPA